MILDVVSVLPFDILTLMNSGEDGGGLSGLKIIKVARLLRLAKMVRVLKTNKMVWRIRNESSEEWFCGTSTVRARRLVLRNQNTL